jgi:hypothetical protein
MNSNFITQIVTDVLNLQYFTVGDFFDVTYKNTERYLTVCIEKNGDAVKLMAVHCFDGKLSFKGRLVIIDNKNLSDFASIRAYTAIVDTLPSGADGLGVILKAKE